MITNTIIGLVNGVQCIIKKIWYYANATPGKDLPAVVWVECNGYSGPDTPGWDGINPKWIPIIPVTANWENCTGKSLSRTQLPLALAWAITIHKSQGITLNKATIELEPKTFSLARQYLT